MPKPMLDLTYLPNHPDRVGWKERHLAVLERPLGLPGLMVAALKAWLDYAREHERRFGSEIGDDSVLGPAWAQWGSSLRTLLNGDLGHLDGGTLDTIICQNLTTQGFDPDGDRT